MNDEDDNRPESGPATAEDAQLSLLLSAIPSFTVEKLVKLYLKTREAKAAATRAYDVQDAKMKSIMSTCENWLLKRAQDSGVEGFTTPLGTTYKAKEKQISIADDALFYGFVLEQKDLNFFQRRVSGAHVDAYAKENEGAVPPGLNVFTEEVMRVRKSTKGGK